MSVFESAVKAAACRGDMDLSEPVKIKLIPHYGGPCPVDGDAIVKYYDGYMIITEGCKKGQFETPLPSVSENAIDWRLIIAYCPIEIKEG